MIERRSKRMPKPFNILWDGVMHAEAKDTGRLAYYQRITEERETTLHGPD